MALMVPPGITSMGMVSVFWVDALASPGAPTLAELTSATAALDIGCLLHAFQGLGHAPGAPFEQAVFIQCFVIVMLPAQQHIEPFTRIVKPPFAAVQPDETKNGRPEFRILFQHLQEGRPGTALVTACHF